MVAFDLPAEALTINLVSEDGRAMPQPMHLDTVFLDIAAASLRDWRVHLSWRVNFEPDLYQVAQIHRLTKAPSADDIRQAIRKRVA